MLIVTTNDLPGYRIDRVLGEVFGITVRAIGFGGAWSGLNSSELPALTNVVLSARDDAMTRLIYEGRRRGGNAILAMRFDVSGLTETCTQICAYGTAVWAEPVTDAARAQYEAMVATGQVPSRPLGPPGAPPMPNSAPR